MVEHCSFPAAQSKCSQCIPKARLWKDSSKCQVPYPPLSFSYSHITDIHRPDPLPHNLPHNVPRRSFRLTLAPHRSPTNDVGSRRRGSQTHGIHLVHTFPSSAGQSSGSPEVTGPHETPRGERNVPGKTMHAKRVGQAPRSQSQRN